MSIKKQNNEFINFLKTELKNGILLRKELINKSNMWIKNALILWYYNI